MSSEIDNLFPNLPFYGLTDYALMKEIETTKNYKLSLMQENGFDKIVKQNKFLNSMNNPDALLCSYYDVDEFIKLKIQGSDCLNIFSLNISSLPKHAAKLTCYLYALETTFDVIVIIEIVKNNLSSMENLFKGFTFYYDPPSTNAKGGVGIYMSNRLGKVTRKSDLEYIKTCDCATCEIESVCITFNCYNKQFTILGIYRHPSGNKNHFNKDLEKCIKQFERKDTSIVIGDTNLDLMRFDTNKAHTDYANMLFSNGYLPYITYPTRITPHTATLIDHIFIKSSSMEYEIISGIFYANISDHLPNFASLKWIKKTQTT